MVKFTALKAGVLTVENTSKTAKTVLIYVPNKDSMPYKLEAGASFKITTLIYLALLGTSILLYW